MRNGVAVVELADACGLNRLPAGHLAPLTASSTGFGEVVAAALDAGCHRVILGVGGSASTDGGAGMLTALGVRLLDAAGHLLSAGGAALEHLDRVDTSGLHPSVRSTEFVLASDVDNPLLGATGAAAVYGPQKGATPDDVARLDGALRRWSTGLARHDECCPSDRPGIRRRIFPARERPGASGSRRSLCYMRRPAPVSTCFSN